MDKITKEALQVSKEIVVKFIEVGRISPANFHEIFPAVYEVVLQTINTPTVEATDPSADKVSRK